MTTELTEIWNAAGQDSNGQLGIASKDGSYPNLRPVIDSFVGVNNGELPDSEQFPIISAELSNNEITVFKATTGEAYITGQSKIEYDDKLRLGGSKNPRKAELLVNLPEAERLSRMTRIKEAGINAAGVLDVTIMNRSIYDIYSGYNSQEPDAIALLSGGGIATRASDGTEGVGTDSAGNIISGISQVTPVRVSYENIRSFVAVLIDTNGGLWFPLSEGVANFKRVVDSGVTSVALDAAGNLLLLKDSKLYKVRNFSNVVKTLTGESEPLRLRNITGGKAWERLYGTETGDELSDTYNLYLLEADGTLWSKGTNQYGELGVRAGLVQNWTRYITSSKVAEILPRAEYTFIKRKE